MLELGSLKYVFGIWLYEFNLEVGKLLSRMWLMSTYMAPIVWTRLMWQPYHVITWTQWLQLGMKCMKCVVWYIRFFFYVSRVAFLNPLAYSSLPKGHGKIYILIWLKLVQQVPMNAWTWFGDFRVGALTCFMVWLKPKNSSTQLNLPIVMLGST
jgi:hypothetical protein